MISSTRGYAENGSNVTFMDSNNTLNLLVVDIVTTKKMLLLIFIRVEE